MPRLNAVLPLQASALPLVILVSMPLSSIPVTGLSRRLERPARLLLRLQWYFAA
ncbi:hypothetical protein O0881_00650 [Janthinobacterium sp. SUN100]|uniref:hypothetical protein n=1 Tax=Janthinobacterium sp. SUN100 TaxID=3004101 RepID=UPI0025B1429B|nr:hypothetical protein [Janthinobacterium sp. SUN100]MDN2700500.1 hypothetical protein [Janthinobacterium sp. SUN100]